MQAELVDINTYYIYVFAYIIPTYGVNRIGTCLLYYYIVCMVYKPQFYQNLHLKTMVNNRQVP